jgi:hypothetical protein
LTVVNAQNFASTDIICRNQRFLLCERADSGQSPGQSTMKDSHLNDDQDWFLTTRRPPVWTAVRDFSNGADKEDQGTVAAKRQSHERYGRHGNARPRLIPCQRQGKLTAIKVRLSQNR